MSHLREEDLILFHYGDLPEHVAAAQHLAACEACARRLDDLRRLFDAADELPVPERGADYGAQVWQRLQPRLERPRPWWRRLLGGVGAGQGWGRLAWAGGAAALLLAAFLAGRYWQGGAGGAAPNHEVRERILLVAVGGHLEKSQRLLIEIVNAGDGRRLDDPQTRLRAEALAASNRIYRRTADRSGNTTVAGVLDDLERVLVEIAAGGDGGDPNALGNLRRRIEDHGLLMRVRALGQTAQRGKNVEVPSQLEL